MNSFLEEIIEKLVDISRNTADIDTQIEIDSLIGFIEQATD
ncbi:hypothetical protein [Neobacillus niacini]|jgi:hypothetical protein|nr:hypothetical protein [Neobacillus niacini]MDR7001595.1 hypothetical protein [Neobacillus niacini]